MSDTDLSTSLDNFFSSISNILNQPESDSVRNLAVLKGQTLTADINNLAVRAGQLRSDLNDRVGQSADDINRLLAQVAKLNMQIANAEGGGASGSDAVGLRDQRNSALTQLAQLIDVKTQEQPTEPCRSLPAAIISCWKARRVPSRCRNRPTAA